MRLVIILYIIWASHIAAAAQSYCDNIGFERGTVAGFEMYRGEYSDGEIKHVKPDLEKFQHTVKHVSDGFDEIALKYCTLNKALPVVGMGMGQYSLKLGDEKSGAQVSILRRKIDVTDANNFLVLNYAVVLEDPDHIPIEQPKFELSILDEFGNLFPCGRYLVVADRNLDGFENCGSWRVKPWTSAGFELKSFTGQTITIEIIAVDCGLGAHAGYAYINLECRALQIEIDGYCPGSTVASMTVTEGFDKYRWNTGDTTNRLEINNPKQGDVYYVDVTSSTGCTIRLTDTLPHFETLEIPELDDVNDKSICEGEAFFYWPSGKHINRLEWIGYGTVYDSIFINPLTSTTYTLVAKDDYGCSTDTLRLLVKVNPAKFLSYYTGEASQCDATTLGSVTLRNGLPDPVRISINNVDYTDQVTIGNLMPGSYTLYGKSEDGCIDSANFEIRYGVKANIRNASVRHATCDEKGSVFIETNYFNPSNCFLYMNGEDVAPMVYLQVDTGWYTIIFMDSLKCSDTSKVYVGEEVSDPNLTAYTVLDASCNKNNAIVELMVENAMKPYWFSIKGNPHQSSNVFNGLADGLFTFYVTDGLGCQDSVAVLIGRRLSSIESVEVISGPCPVTEASISMKVENGCPPYILHVEGGQSITFSEQTLFSTVVQRPRINVEDACRCAIDTIIHFDLQEPEIPDVFVPNAFSPDFDGVNDELIISASNAFPYYINKYVIFNRWGGVVYSVANFELAGNQGKFWDGTRHGVPVESGVYVYMIQYTDECGVLRMAKGNVTLLR